MEQIIEGKKRKYRGDDGHAKVPKTFFSIPIEKFHSIKKNFPIINNDTCGRLDHADLTKSIWKVIYPL